MISIVMAVKDSLDYTKRGIQSILENTECDFELVVVDNGSAQDTVDYLNSLNQPQIRILRNEENIGCAGAWNQGIKAATGEYVMVANNDIEVPRGWLTTLQKVHAETGAAWVTPCIREGDLDYDFEAFHKEFTGKFGDKLWEDQFRAMALFSRRDLYTEVVGMFDEAYKFGVYEDEDMFWRIKKKGMRSVITGSVIIHHYGSKTVSSQKRKTPQFIKNNRKTFHRKWWTNYFTRKRLKRRIKKELIDFKNENGFVY
ncbi:MAG: glycosyltransferase family 2 protein [Verrucomicrobiales bacterium]|nr:glycosyltransferase family 2 protein [Verrucomicrobiales bacterium]